MLAGFVCVRRCALHSRGHVVAGGDVRRRRGRESCPRMRGLPPAGADRTRPRGMSPAALPVGPVVIICGQFAVCGPGSRGGRLG